MGRFIHIILDIEKIESGKRQFDLQSYRIQPLLVQAVEANQTYAEQLVCACSLRGAVPDLVIPLDSNRFMEVMANLLSNGAEFSPAGAIVEVTAQRRHGLALDCGYRPCAGHPGGISLENLRQIQPS